jgi:hypothetical protein
MEMEMEASRFEDMVRYASIRGSRRAALQTLAGGLLAVLAPAASAEKGKRHKKAKRSNRCAERCGGRCVSRCPDVMTRNGSTCQCECPSGMTKCGQICVGADRCCPGEKRCGGGCIREEACCPYTHRQCNNGACITKDACCPGTDTCPAAPDGCCQPGEACSDDGCCPVNDTSDVCGGKCTDLDTNDHCGACGNRCGACKTCRNVDGDLACAGPDRSAPACEDCLEGQVVPAVSCGDHCCGIGAECCGGGCCASGRCQVVNGQTCCLKVIDNIPYCQVM